MPSLKAKELRKLKQEELEDRIAELRAELVKLKSAAGRGTLKKESGKVKFTRRDLARLLTVLREKELGRSEKA